MHIFTSACSRMYWGILCILKGKEGKCLSHKEKIDIEILSPQKKKKKMLRGSEKLSLWTQSYLPYNSQHKLPDANKDVGAAISN